MLKGKQILVEKGRAHPRQRQQVQMWHHHPFLLKCEQWPFKQSSNCSQLLLWKAAISSCSIICSFPLIANFLFLQFLNLFHKGPQWSCPLWEEHRGGRKARKSSKQTTGGKQDSLTKCYGALPHNSVFHQRHGIHLVFNSLHYSNK